ncbi:MAG TPA: urease accessory protein UreD [Gemmatimonadales bacterium]
MTVVAGSVTPATLARDDPHHYTPRDLPPAFAAFETPVDGLGVGRPGKVGLLELTFTPVAGATRVTHHFQQFPLQLFRPVYLDPHRPDMAFVYVMSQGGTLQGDRVRIDVECMPGAAAHVTTQAAGKVYRMEQNYATHLVHLRAGEQSVLEFLPDPIIPYRDSRYYARTELTAHPAATVIMGELLLPGRVAHGEHQDYALYSSRLTAHSPEGRLLFTDTLELTPRQRPLNSPGRLGQHAVLATLYVVSRQVPGRALADGLHARVAEMPDVWGGASELPNGCGAWVRLLGATSSTVSAALHAAWDEARLAVLGAPAPNRRKT